MTAEHVSGRGLRPQSGIEQQERRRPQRGKYERLPGQRRDAGKDRDRDCRVDQNISAKHRPVVVALLQPLEPKPHRETVYLRRKVTVDRVPARQGRIVTLHTVRPYQDPPATRRARIGDQLGWGKPRVDGGALRSPGRGDDPDAPAQTSLGALAST